MDPRVLGRTRTENVSTFRARDTRTTSLRKLSVLPPVSRNDARQVEQDIRLLPIPKVLRTYPQSGNIRPPPREFVPASPSLKLPLSLGTTISITSIEPKVLLGV
jgi:hypothetical protein